MNTKRLFDIAATLLVMPAILPILLFTAGLVRIKLGGHIFFHQPRAGLNGHEFVMYKFRSMSTKTDKEGNLLPDDQRLNAFGKFLRSSSLDELPELWNVLKGDMSLVGPRPLLMQYLDRYTPEQMRRHSVRPGITGWAQINGRNAISWEQKFKLDTWYVDNHSFQLDFAILLRTVAKILRRDDISNAGHSTMPEFLGEVK